MLYQAIVDHFLDDDELQFYANEYICVLDKNDDGWWNGYVEDHPETIGLFPENYVKVTETLTGPSKSWMRTDSSV